MEDTIIPKWLTVSEYGNIATYFGASFARDSFSQGCMVFVAVTASGVLNYAPVHSLDDIVDDDAGEEE